ncbi:hypothetical protein GCM10009642_28080 [Nocardiopsis metallicus]
MGVLRARQEPQVQSLDGDQLTDLHERPSVGRVGHCPPVVAGVGVGVFVPGQCALIRQPGMTVPTVPEFVSDDTCRKRPTPAVRSMITSCLHSLVKEAFRVLYFTGSPY